MAQPQLAALAIQPESLFVSSQHTLPALQRSPRQITPGPEFGFELELPLAPALPLVPPEKPAELPLPALLPPAAPPPA
jgi:hypothetical protein